MSSDTPRTNAHVKRMIDNGQSPEGLEYWARDLERELNAANEHIKRLEEAGDQLATHALAGGVPQLFMEFVENWKQAKEAKP